ncbi:MAG: helix-turn-helix transcriptional regulator [Aequorivita sp.]
MDSAFDSIKSRLNQQFQVLQKRLENGDLIIDDLGSVLPASVILHDMVGLQPTGVIYMNNWGCEQLGTTAEEINAMGDAYYTKYFVKEEVAAAFEGIEKYLLEGDFDKQYNFFQRVKLFNTKKFKWFYSVCKVVQIKTDEGISNKMIMVSSPVDGIDSLISRVNKVLDEDHFIKNNYKLFAALTKREKSIIVMISRGRTSKEIADELNISVHTVHTHRKNIIQKTKCNSISALLKFASAFELV